MNRWVTLALVPALIIGGCEHNPMESKPNLEPLPPARGPGSASAGLPPALISAANSETPLLAAADGASLGDITLDFADSDIREVVAQTLGAVLHANYTIDPAVRGTATLHSAGPMSRGRLLTTLQSLLAAEQVPRSAQVGRAAARGYRYDMPPHPNWPKSCSHSCRMAARSPLNPAPTRWSSSAIPPRARR